MSGSRMEKIAMPAADRCYLCCTEITAGVSLSGDHHLHFCVPCWKLLRPVQQANVRIAFWQALSVNAAAAELSRIRAILETTVDEARRRAADEEREGGGGRLPWERN